MSLAPLSTITVNAVSLASPTTPIVPVITWATETVIEEALASPTSLAPTSNPSSTQHVSLVPSSVSSSLLPAKLSGLADLVPTNLSSSSSRFKSSLSTQQPPGPLALPTTTTVTVVETHTVIVPTPLQPAAVTKKPTVTRTGWSAPAHLTDLTDFNILAFPGGPKNLDIVHGIPATASATPDKWNLAASESGESDQFTAWDNSSSVLQLFYPEDSINPGNKPFGGAQFYATPLDISEAKNVTLEYSVFFPVDFDWVRGGKLPGLYGGHTGCSGGDAALDCFSTRLMWRRKGEGELYLYVPKDEQTDELCSHRQSVCDATYGLSIGRGSFTWARGAWTTVRQTVTLNTPGQQDGAFTLDVNGKRVIARDDVYYRGEALAAEDRWRGRERRKKKKKQRPQGLGDLIGALLGGLLMTTEAEELQKPSEGPNDGTLPVVELGSSTGTQGKFMVEMLPLRVEKVARVSAVEEEKEDPTATFPPAAPIKAQLEEWDEKPVGFVGLFFSTFFGGHDPEFATPRDQYVWFKDFAISYNE